jgi:hypothetical protein
MEIPAHVSWALAKNHHDILQALLAKYPLGHSYWNYLSELISSLRDANCKGIQDKMADVDNLWKLRSTVSELEIARLLSEKGKNVEMLPDSFLSGRSPDMHVKDADGEYYVEVVRFSEDEAVFIIQEEMIRYLADPPKPYEVDVTLPADLSASATDCKEREVKESKARTVASKFKKTMNSTDPVQLPLCVKIDDVVFQFSSSPSGAGLPIINFETSVPSGKFVDRIRFLLTDRKQGKAIKRTTWTGEHLKKRYIVAIDCEQQVDEEDVVQALLGKRESYSIAAPKKAVPPEVIEAAKKNWTVFLERVHLLPKGRTVFTSYGVYMTDAICRNVCGVLVYRRLVPRSESMVCFLPNPFAEDAINDSRLTRFI